MAKEFFLTPDNAEITNNCFAEIRSHLGSGLDISVKITEKSQSRSAAQRKLVNIWYTQWATWAGEDRTRQRNVIMYKCGVSIFYRDNICINGAYSADSLDCISKLKQLGMITEYNQLMLEFAAKVTSSSFTVKQNAEYLDNIWRLSVDSGVQLHVPSDCENAKFKGNL